MPRSIRRFIAVSLVALVAMASFGNTLGGRNVVNAQAAIPETASYAPANALAFISVDLDVTSVQWLQAGILAQRLSQELTPDRLFAALAGSAMGDTTAIDPALFLGGESALVVTNPDLSGFLPNLTPNAIASGNTASISGIATNVDLSVANGYVLITLPPDPTAAADALKASLLQQSQQSGQELAVSSYKDVPITVLPANEQAGTPSVAFARLGDAVLAGATAEDVQAIVDVQSGDAPALADDERFSTVISPLPTDHLAVGTLNGQTIGALLSSSAPAAGLSPASGILSVAQSINAFTGFSIASTNEGFRFDSRSTSPVEAARLGANANFSPDLINTMPADTQVLIDGSDLGGTRLVDAGVVILSDLFLGAMSGSFVPFSPAATPAPADQPTAPSLGQAADQAFSTLALLLGFNLRSELFGLLDGEFAVGSWGINGQDLSSANAILVSKTSDPERVAATVGTLSNFLGMGAGAEPGATPGAGADAGLTTSTLTISGQPVQLGIGVVDDTFVLALGGGAAALSGSGDRLVDTDLYQAATADLPADRNGIMFVNLASLQAENGSALDAINLPVGNASMISNAQAFALAGFREGDLAGTQGLLYIPAP